MTTHRVSTAARARLLGLPPSMPGATHTEIDEDSLVGRDHRAYNLAVSLTLSNYGPKSRFLPPSSGPDGGPGAASHLRSASSKVPAAGICAPYRRADS